MADCKESKEETNGPSPPIIMKFDAPDESSENSANDEADGQSAEEQSDRSKTSSSSPLGAVKKIARPVLAQSKYESLSCSINELSRSASTCILKPTILRPSQLGTAMSNSVASSTKSEAEIPKNSNPFLKVTDEAVFGETNVAVHKNNESGDKKQESNSDTNNKETKQTTEAPKFIPLGANPKENDTSVNNSVGPNCSTSSFVFGQNLKERVTVTKDGEGTENKDESDENDEESKKEKSAENGSSELLFSNVATVCSSTSRSGLTLTQAAQEMEEANRASKRKYSQVTPLTGEEGETNVLQINCKLFAFDKVTSSWKERGRGTLRLNDLDDESRIVGRAAGTQRLMLNTKVWPGMTAERAGPKSLRLTAMDAVGDIRIFIVQAAPAEVDQMYNLLMPRLKRAKERQPKKLATDH